MGWTLVLALPWAAAAQPFPAPGGTAPDQGLYDPPSFATSASGGAMGRTGPTAPQESRPITGQTAPLPPALPGRDAALPSLSPPGRSARKPPSAPRRLDGLQPLVTIGGSLAVVLGLFFVFAWLMRRANPNAIHPLPREVLEVLGRAPLTSRQQVQLLRCGRKLVLISVTADCAETLTEITDPEEVDYLTGLCHQSRPGSSTAAFRQALRQFSEGSAETGPPQRGGRD